MAKTKSLSLSTTYQDITARTVCKTIMVKEAESVANYPTVNLKYRGSSADDDEELTAGKPKYITKPDGVYFQVNEVAGQIGTASGTTTGLQYEE